MGDNMKLLVHLIINKAIRNQEEIKEYVKNVESYINHIDELYKTSDESSLYVTFS